MSRQPVRKDPCWKHAIDTPGLKKGETICKHCQTHLRGGGINRLKYHLARIPGRDAEPCPGAPPEVVREVTVWLESFEASKEMKKRQREQISGLMGVGESSSSIPRPPIPPSTGAVPSSTGAGVSGSGSASASASASASGSASVGIGPRVRMNRLDSYIIPRTTPGSQPSLESMGWNKDKHDAAKAAIGDFWFFSDIPFHVARSPYWQSMIDAVTVCGAGFKAPNDEELKGPILAQKVANVKATIDHQRAIWGRKGCTIMTDGWTDRRNRTLLNFLVSSSGATVFLKSIDASGNTKNAEFLCGAIEEVIHDVGEANVVQIVTDNAANYVAAGKLLMERHPSLFWTPCAAHCLDLMLEDLGKLAWIGQCVDTAKNICKFIYNHTWVLNLMRQYTGQRELSRPGITRFATNFITLQSLLRSKGALRRMVVSEEWTSSTYAKTTAGVNVADCIFDEQGFWAPTSEIVKFTEPLVILLRVADGEKPSMGYIYEGMDRAKEAIRAIYAGVEDKYLPIWEIIDRRWHNQLHRPLHAAAYYLNPAFQFLRDFRADAEVLSGLYTVIERMSPSNFTAQIMADIDTFSNARGDLFSRDMCKTSRTTMRPDTWWERFGANVPTLQNIAIRVLSQPCSASGCERNWSMFENIHSKKRNRLSVQRLNDLVFVHYNLRLRHRQILESDNAPITLEEVEPQSEGIAEAEDPIFSDDEDLDFVDEADIEAEVVAMAEEEERARMPGGASGTAATADVDTLEDDDVDITQTEADAMAASSSRTYLRRLRRKGV